MMNTDVETKAWLSSAERALLRRSTRGDMPTRDEVLEVAGGDETKADMLAGALQHVAETRENNVGMRGFIDAQRQADELSRGYRALHVDVPSEDVMSSAETAGIDQAVERIVGNPANRGIAR